VPVHSSENEVQGQGGLLQDDQGREREDVGGIGALRRECLTDIPVHPGQWIMSVPGVSGADVRSVVVGETLSGHRVEPIASDHVVLIVGEHGPVVTEELVLMLRPGLQWAGETLCSAILGIEAQKDAVAAQPALGALSHHCRLPMSVGCSAGSAPAIPVVIGSSFSVFLHRSDATVGLSECASTCPLLRNSHAVCIPTNYAAAPIVDISRIAMGEPRTCPHLDFLEQAIVFASVQGIHLHPQLL
jgi:hypothetical protein